MTSTRQLSINPECGPGLCLVGTSVGKFNCMGVESRGASGLGRERLGSPTHSLGDLGSHLYSELIHKIGTIPDSSG